MDLRPPVAGLVLALLLCGPLSGADGLTRAPAHQPVNTSNRTVDSCPVTLPNGKTPPGEHHDAHFHGNGALWTILWPDSTVVFEPDGPGFAWPDGALEMKLPWWRSEPTALTITGKRLDATAAPLRARIPCCYSGGFQATSLIFPTEGCWEVTGRVGESSLTFVTRVVNHRAD